MKEVEARLRISAVDRTAGVLNSIGNRLKAITRGVDAVNRYQAQTLERRFRDVDRMTSLVSKSLAALSAGYVAKEAYVDFAERERTLTRIAITAGATDDKLQDVRDTIGRLSKELAMSPDDAVEGLDTLVASGKSLEEALAFLPDVMKAAQATGAKVSEMANTAIKSTSALNIPIDEINKSFDLMIQLGKAGQFEAKDMASYIPGLANSWASLGYKGNDGLMKLGANLQTIREDTADASAAATQLGDILGKMYGDETANKFKKMGVPNLRKELDAARKSGEDTLDAFVRITERALKGDYSKLPMLFGDKEMRLGMQSLLTSRDSYKRYLDVGRDPNVAGATERDVKRIIQDPKAPIDRMKASFDRTVQALGKAFEGPVSSLLESFSEATDKEVSLRRALEKQGFSGLSLEWQMLNKLPIGPFPAADDFEKLARDGGYMPSDRQDLKDLQKAAPFAWQTLGRWPNRPVSKFDPAPNPDAQAQAYLDDLYNRDWAGAKPERKFGPAYRKALNEMSILSDKLAKGEKPEGSWNLEGTAPKGSWNFDPVANVNSWFGQAKQDLEAGGQKVASGGDEAGRALVEAGQRFAQVVTAAGNELRSILASVKVNVNATGVQPTVNANIGRTDTFARSPGTGHQ